MAHPLGYYASVCAGHPGHTILKELESVFTNEKLDEESLAYLIGCCAALPFDAFDVMPTSTWKWTNEVKDCFNLLIQLRNINSSLVLDLIPFLHAQLEARR